MKHITLITITLLCLLSGCKKENTNDKLVSETKVELVPIRKHLNDSLNLSVLLDLSDRISYPYQKGKDLKHVMNIAEIFKGHVMNKKSILLQDHLQVFFEPNPSPGKTDEVATELKFEITKATTKNTIESIEKKYEEFIPKLYEWAQENPDTKKGADIWRFFKDKVADYCIEEHHRNILIILTDGYLYHEGTTLQKGKRTTRINQKLLNDPVFKKHNWETVVKTNNYGVLWEEGELKDLEVLVLGIDKHNSKTPYAEDIIKHYWSNWFKEMGIKKYKIKSKDSPTHLKKVIQDFIIHK